MCDHADVEFRDGENVCIECGQIIEEMSMIEEWNYESKNIRSGRCQGPKRTRRDNIDKDLREQNIDADIRERVIEIYEKVVHGQTRRSSQRKGLYAAALYRTYEEFGRKRDPESIRKQFTITVSNFNKGLRALDCCPELNSGAITIANDKENTIKYLSAYINYFRSKTSDRDSKCIRQILDEIWAKDRFDEFKPQNLAAAVVYFYMKHKNPTVVKLSKSDFAKKADITESIIAKIDTKLKRIFQPGNVSSSED